MLDIVAIVLAGERTADLARSALPDGPVRPDGNDGRDGDRLPRLALARRRLGRTLRRLADLVEPAPECSPTAAAGHR